MKSTIEPMLFANICRFLYIAIMIHLWIIDESTISSFILILLLLIMTSLRWRFDLPVWTVIIDIIICCFYFRHTYISYYGLVLPMFELVLKEKLLFSILIFIVMCFLKIPSVFLFWNVVQTFFFGKFIYFTLKEQQRYRLEADEQRKHMHDLEQVKIDLLKANQAASHQAELMERYRISRELHDHLGHDLTGALLALQAYEYVKDSNEGNKLLDEVRSRLEQSTKILRETVHNMTSTTLIGIDNLEYIVYNFNQAEVRWRKSGNIQQVPAYIWSFLESYLKEALTNVARHSNATKVEVDLHVTESIVRLSILDNGTVKKDNHTGSGLRSLQMRARSFGGSLSISCEKGFLLVCVIPLEKERTLDENFNSR